jgi:YbbR domain-containing protein
MKRKIFNNIGFKILSVALAISLWFFVTYRGQLEITVESPIEFKNIPEGLELIKQDIRNVNLSVKGHERLLKGLKPADIRVIIDLSEAKKGEASYYFDKNNILIPRTIQVMRIDPAFVTVTLDESSTKVVPVRVAVVGIPEKGYRVKSIAVNPSSVAIEGAKTELARIAFLRTEYIDITGINTDVVQDVRLHTGGMNIRTNIAEVTVTIRITNR